MEESDLEEVDKKRERMSLWSAVLLRGLLRIRFGGCCVLWICLFQTISKLKEERVLKNSCTNTLFSL